MEKGSEGERSGGGGSGACLYVCVFGCGRVCAAVLCEFQICALFTCARACMRACIPASRCGCIGSRMSRHIRPQHGQKGGTGDQRLTRAKVPCMLLCSPVYIRHTYKAYI